MGLLRLKNLRVKSFVGSDPLIKNNNQELTLDIEITYYSVQEEESDNMEDAFDIKELIQEITGRAESSHFNIIEAFTRMVLKTIFEFSRVEKATVTIVDFKRSQIPCDICFTLSDIKN